MKEGCIDTLLADSNVRLSFGLQDGMLADSSRGHYSLFQCRRSAIIPVSSVRYYSVYRCQLFIVDAFLGAHQLTEVTRTFSTDALLLYTKVEAFFGGTDVPIEVAIGVCLATVLTFGSAQRKVSKLLRGNEDAKER